ncbi:polynucleotide adenylyltransferase PcnB [Idiomarina seosinensis]|uniref:polynucleotide adenylyltransferase PcnB n=1 Tax=Idiomarina seosinensis TaxID=281739 RepID=UPI00384E6148
MPRDEHPISRKDISPNALKVLYRLHNAGFDAYLVGGCVRDLLLGLQPKDFDVTTNASPEEVKNLFRNCRLIGRRFRLAHILFGREIIEVATFRGHHDVDNADHKKIAQQDEHGQLVRDNVYGSIEEDAERRDFTVNALYYNIADFCIYDFANGKRDIEAGILRMIGDPQTRYREDPVRMLRAVRFATKLNMALGDDVSEPLSELSGLLKNIPPARLFDEFLKLFMAGKAQANFDLLCRYGLFQQLFPVLKSYLDAADSPPVIMMRKAFANTDQRVQREQRVTPAYLLAVLLWWPLQARREQLENEGGLPPMDALNVGSADVLHRQSQTLSIPKRFSLTVRDIWQMQLRLQNTKGVRAKKTLEQKKFRAGYDFLLLRQESGAALPGENLKQLADFWTKAQQDPNLVVSPSARNEGGKKPSNRRRRGGRSRRKPRSNKPDNNNNDHG